MKVKALTHFRVQEKKTFRRLCFYSLYMQVVVTEQNIVVQTKIQTLKLKYNQR